MSFFTPCHQNNCLIAYTVPNARISRQCMVMEACTDLTTSLPGTATLRRASALAHRCPSCHSCSQTPSNRGVGFLPLTGRVQFLALGGSGIQVLARSVCTIPSFLSYTSTRRSPFLYPGALTKSARLRRLPRDSDAVSFPSCASNAALHELVHLP